MTRRMDYRGSTPIADDPTDAIVRCGSRICPVEIERALLSHPSVLDAAVFGAPDPVAGQRVAAAVLLEGDGDEATLDSILGAAWQQLADDKMPELLVAVDAIPRDRFGKIDRQAMAAVILGIPGHRYPQ